VDRGPSLHSRKRGIRGLGRNWVGFRKAGKRCNTKKVIEQSHVLRLLRSFGQRESLYWAH